jgi:hypothetical protein
LLAAFADLLACAAQRVFRINFLQRPAVAKQRFAKRYRHPELDARLTKTRLQGVRPPTCVRLHASLPAGCLASLPLTRCCALWARRRRAAC